MAYIDPNTIHTPSPGGIPPQTWGDVVNDDLNYLVEMPYVLVAGPNMNVATGTSTAMIIDTEYFDEFAMHSAVSNSDRLTAQEPGIYLINATMQWQGNATGYRMLQIQTSISGVVFAYTQTRLRSEVGDGLVFYGSLMRSMTVGDWVNVCVWQNSGSTLQVLLNQFSLRKMGEL